MRFAFGAAIEFVFSFLQGAISSFQTSIFMIGLLFGKKVSWGGQSRDAYGLGWQTATAQLWPQTLFGIAICTSLLIVNPTVLAWSLPLTAGFVLAIPFAVITASPSLGRLMKRSGLCGIPEDFNPPIEIGAIQAKSANAPR